MQVTIASLKAAIARKNYKWFDNAPNIIGIRTALQVPDVFNDVMCVVYKENGVEKLFTAIFTSEPGTTYQKKLLNEKGVWVMMPAQMIDAYSLGYHQQKLDHKCLRSTGKIYGQREDDRDGKLFNDPTMNPPSWQEGSNIGANIHGALNKKGVDLTVTVGPWSAGCQVFERWSKKEEFIGILENYEKANKSLWKKITEWVFGKSGITYTYTLIEEKDL